MFEPSTKHVEHEIAKIENELIDIDKKIKDVVERMNVLQNKLIHPKFQHAYSSILREIEKINYDLTKIAREIGKEKLNMLKKAAGPIVDISGVNPSLVHEYINLKKRLNELLKQEKHIQKLSNIAKHEQLRIDSINLHDLQTRKLNALKKLEKLKKAKR